MEYVLVIDKNKQPRRPCHSARVQALFVHPNLPEREGGDVQVLELKIDPGSQEIGAAVFSHRGHAIKEKLDSCRARHTRYRPMRFNNRRCAAPWLPPRLNSCLDIILNWHARSLCKLPRSRLALERVKFDMQQIKSAKISSIDYQRGTLLRCEIREYLLEKWNRRRAYCDKRDVPFEIKPIVLRSRGGPKTVHRVHGFQTDDLARQRSIANGTTQGITYWHCCDGYPFQKGAGVSSSSLNGGLLTPYI